MKKLKCYIDLPFMYREKIKQISLSAGITFTYEKCPFYICETKGIYPKGTKKGNHILTITIDAFSYAIGIVLYKPIKGELKEYRHPHIQEQMKRIDDIDDLL